mmetsp:Transcript_6623/g.7613  ORF Transcript_6623/g.7613 Transcript_6623/m.7613 type:complete len:226 (-) Transcript_6623:382-1059(-)
MLVDLLKDGCLRKVSRGKNAIHTLTELFVAHRQVRKLFVALAHPLLSEGDAVVQGVFVTDRDTLRTRRYLLTQRGNQIQIRWSQSVMSWNRGVVVGDASTTLHLLKVYVRLIVRLRTHIKYLSEIKKVDEQVQAFFLIYCCFFVQVCFNLFFLFCSCIFFVSCFIFLGFFFSFLWFFRLSSRWFRCLWFRGRRSRRIGDWNRSSFFLYCIDKKRNQLLILIEYGY